MKSFAVLLALASLVVASPALLADTQSPLTKVLADYPGYSLDLAELRLVQIEGQEPTWVSELEKASHPTRSVDLSLTLYADQHEGSGCQLLRHVSGCHLYQLEHVYSPRSSTETQALGSSAHLRVLSQRECPE